MSAVSFKFTPARVVFFAFVVAVDCLIIFDAFSLAYIMRFIWEWATFHTPVEPPSEYLKAMAVVAYFWLLLFKVSGLYDFSKTRSSIDTVHLIVRSVTFGTIIILSLSYFYRGFSFSRLACVYAWAMSIVFFSVFRIAVARVRRDVFREGFGTRRVLLVGAGRISRFLVDRIHGQPELGYRVVGVLDDETPEGEFPLPVFGRLSNLESTIQSKAIDRVFITNGALEPEEQLEIIATCDRLGVPLSMVPPTYDLVINHRDFEEIDGIPVVSVREREARWLYERCKRFVDVVGSSLLLLTLSPLFALIAWAIRRRNDGPVFFSQVRVGRDGRLFRMWKFRTMVADAEDRLKDLVDIESLSQPVFKLDEDPRVTPIGRFLRRSSLDELPQLYNVLLGEMSLVGPRPEEEKVVRRYGVQERRRLKANPGITGLQQVECRGTKDMKLRIRWDIIYLRKQSLFLDFWILLKTVYVVALGRGAR
ncbi:MAG: sugar transferase [Planctomycetota bacterium]